MVYDEKGVYMVTFDEMGKEECQEIFIRLLKKNDEKSKDYINKVDTFIELHQKMTNEMKNNLKTIDPIVTLRNLKYCCYLNKNLISPRNAAEISYTARFPKNERKDFDKILEKFGDFQIEKNVDEEIELGLKENFLYYNESYKKCVYLAITAIREGLHPLLIGEKGSGLTTLSKLIASIYKKDYEFLLCSSETSVEDLIGCYQPNIKNKDGIQNLSSYIKWNDGPILKAARKGISIILDNINYSKPQVIECLNPLLEENSKYNNVTYNVLEKENEGPIQIKKGFTIIGTMVITKENPYLISKALMNRFVAIYLDKYFEFNDKNIDIIIDNTVQKLNKQIKESFENIKKNKNINLNEDSECNDESSENNSFSDEDEGNNDKIEIPDWYNIKSISNETIKEMKNFIKKEKCDIKIMKHLIKKITKLSLIFERINKFGFSMKDCYNFIDFNSFIYCISRL